MKCMPNDEYNPDNEMVKVISNKAGCNLPWSKIKIQSLEDCKLESDFNKYLDGILKYQKDIIEIPRKCKFNIWTLSQFEDLSGEGNASVVFDMMVTEGQVDAEKEVYVYTTEYFISALGGYLGLFLGGSLLGIMNYIQSLLSNICLKSE